MDTQILMIVGGAGLLALVYAVIATGRVRAFEVANEKVVELSAIIQKGAMTFLAREYKALVPFVVVVALLLGWKINMASSVSFIFGALCSGLAGYVGMKVATGANGKTAFAASEGVNPALRIAFMGGTVMGMSVVGIGILGIVISYFIFRDPLL